MPYRILTSLLVALALVFSACSGDDSSVTTTTSMSSESTSSSTEPTDSSTTTTAAATTTAPSTEVVVSLEGAPEGAVLAIEVFYGWLADRQAPEPAIPEGLRAHIADAPEAGELALQGEWSASELRDRDDVGVAVFDDDILLLVDGDSGWRIVGAKPASVGLGPWYGDPVRHVLVLGTDARLGRPQLEARADSIHVLSSAVAEQSGTILGFPRDSYIETPEGHQSSPEGRFLKFTHANYWFGPDGMKQIAEETTGLDIDGYLITGFGGFADLVDAFAGVPVDVPMRMADRNAQAFLDAGLQILFGEDALGFSRSRSVPNADFRRSLHQGMVIDAALGKVQEEFGPLDLPRLLAILVEYAWTDLDAEALLTLGAGAFELDRETIRNIVLSGRGTTRNTQYVVLLDEEVAHIFADLEDGILTEELPPGTLTDEG